jgi:ligand-binding sensor domain-containing protein/signal transduction histidine kinase
MLIRNTLLTLILLAASAGAAAPPDTGGYGYRTWRIEDGLPENQIRNLSQTPDGYLWIGTSEGLVRFDGVRFTVFDRYNTPALGDDGIVALRLSRDGVLWIGTEGGGLAAYRAGVFRHYGPREGMTNSFVRSIFEDSRRQLWIGTDRGLFRRKGDSFERIACSAELAQVAVSSVLEDENGQIEAVSPASLVAVRNGRLERANGSCDTSQIRSLRFVGGQLWAIGNAGGAGLVKNGCVQPDPGMPGIALRTIVRDRAGTVWIGTDGHGLLRRTGGVFRSFTAAPQLADNTVSSVFEDAASNLWIGSDDGLIRLSRSSVQNVGKAEGLDDENVLTVSPDRAGVLWITTVSGKVYQVTADGAHRYFLPGAARDFAIRTVFEDSTGARWFGAFLAGVVRESGGKATVYSSREGFGGAAVRQIAEDRTGMIWFALDSGLIRWDGHAFRAYSLEDGLAYPSVRCLLVDRSGDVLVGTDSGLTRIHKGEAVRDGEFAKLAKEKIRALYQDEAGTLWIGTRGGGLIRFRSGIATRYERGNGLTSNSVYAVLEDRNGNLWISTSSGVVSARREELDDAASNGQPIHVTPYGTGDGMLSSQVNGGTQPVAAGAGEHGDDGFWFATAKGAVHITSQVTRGVPHRPLMIERVIADSETLPVSGRVTIPAHVSQLQIDFTLCDLSSPQRVSFRYKLEGFDQNWIPAVRGRSANYTHVPPGDYTFHVMADDPGSTSPTSEAAMGLTLQPALYQTLWFYALAALAAGLSVWGGFAVYARQTRARYNLLLAERTRLAREMHDTVIQGCVGVATLLEASAGFRPVDPAESKHLVDQARTQVTKTLEEAREAVWNLRHSPPAESAVSALFDLARQLGEEHNIRVETEMAGSGALDSERDRAILLIGREAIGNAVAHARPSRIGVRIESSDAAVSLEVADDGVGFDPERQAAQESRHFGLIGMRERAEAAGGSFLVESSPGRGTKVRAILPSPGRAASGRVIS